MKVPNIQIKTKKQKIRNDDLLFEYLAYLKTIIPKKRTNTALTNGNNEDIPIVLYFLYNII